MSIFHTIGIAASGLTAQRLRMDIAASNIANAQTTDGPDGGPYRPEAVSFRPNQMGPNPTALGVEATAVENPANTPVRVYDPRHPDADATGFVEYPDVDIAAQVADMMSASRSYSLNTTVVQAIKQSALDALEMGR